MAEEIKFDQARRIAAALCYIGLAHLDRVTILPFGAALADETMPGRGKGRIFRVFEILEQMGGERRDRSEGRPSPRIRVAHATRQDWPSSLSGLSRSEGFEPGTEDSRVDGHDCVRGACRIVESDSRSGRARRRCDSWTRRPGELRDIDVTPRSPTRMARRGRYTPTELESCLRLATNLGYTPGDAGSAVRANHFDAHFARGDSSHELRRHGGLAALLLMRQPRRSPCGCSG
jgi:uncharacterized protein (DUF58 family)